MAINRRLLPLIVLIAAFFAVSCGPAKKPPGLPLSEAHLKFQKILKDENNIDASLISYPQTLWIYVPIESSLFAFSPTDKGASKSRESKESISVQYLEVKYADGDFRVDYDFAKSKSYESDHGYQTKYSDEFSTKQRAVFTAINRTYTNVEHPPEFIVLTVADIESGIEMEILVNFGDLKLASMDMAFQQEFVSHRTLADQPKGDKKIIGDREGKHLKTYDITWQDFIARQIEHRIKFKYTRSAFPPSDNAVFEILTAVKDATIAYDFEDADDFKGVSITDLNTKSVEAFDRPATDNYLEEHKELKGKLHTIRFGFGEKDSQ